MVTNMNRMRNQLTIGTTAMAAAFMLMMAESIVAHAEGAGYDFPNSGTDAAFSTSNTESEELTQDKPLTITEKFDAEKERIASELVMADVTRVLNVRAEASEDSEKVGFMYKDCGGTILEQKDGWTRIRSGALTGWCSDEYLLFGNDALLMADDVGRWLVTLNSEAVRVRTEPDPDSEVLTILAKGDYVDFVEIINDDWISIDYEGDLGYLDTSYIDITYHIDAGETMEQVKTREKIEEQIRKEAEEAEAARTRTQNRGKVAADADELRLLGALIYCEAGNQSYEGKVAVGAVVMNRVKSPAYPGTIYSVIYASGQFTPAMSGKLATVYNNGFPDIDLQAAVAALNGETTVGGATHFRRNDGRDGYVLGAHVFW